MSLTEHILERAGDERYAEALPADLGKQAQKSEGVDLEEIDLSASMWGIFSRRRHLLAAATMLALVVIFWAGLLVADGTISEDQLLSGDVPLAELVSFTAYWYFSAALALGGGITGAIWYVWRAPPRICKHHEMGPLKTFLLN
ncbi:hypothetical protein C435_22119, partial [Haloarcula marismortui ATCC 33799]